MKKNQSSVSLNNASWSHQYGISKENNGAPLFGLNPNLNIEDEYIENLLKQIHFMNMEVKLLKEKQAQSEGNCLWSIINRANEPLVKNIVDSNEKYQSMKKNVDTNVNKTEYENIKLADQQSSILKKMNHLQNRIAELTNRKKEAEKVNLFRKEKISSKISELQQKLKHMNRQKEEQSKRNNDLLAQNEQLLNNIQKQKFLGNAQAKKIKNQEDIQIQIEAALKKQIQNYKDKIKTLRFSIENNIEFQKGKENQDSIKENLNKVQGHIANYQFQLLQLSESIKLAQGQKNKEVIERKRLMQEYESLRIILKEITTLNAARLNQEINVKKRQSMDIHKGQTQGKKLEKNLEEVKRKLHRTDDSEKVLRQEVQYLERQLLKIKSKRQKFHENELKIRSNNDKKDTQLTTYSNEFKRLEDQCEKISSLELNSAIELNQVQTEIVFLRQRKDYLSETLDLKQTMNKTRLEQLQKVVVKNKDVNQTVGLLMQKWQEIKQFSKI